MLVLLYVLALLLSKFVPDDDPNWRLFISLLNIIDIVVSPAISHGHVSYLADLMVDHHSLFRITYPNVCMKYKHHRMVHYPSLMQKNGPLLDMWVIRYKAKHEYFKRLAHVMCNFRNVCKTLANRNQIRQAFAWLRSPPFNQSLEVGTGNSTIIMMHPEFHELYPNSADRQFDAFLANYVLVHGTRYERGYTVIVDMNEDSSLVLGYINTILVCNGRVALAMKMWSVCRFDWKSQSYLCKLSHKQCACWQAALLDHHPLTALQCSSEHCAFYHVRLRLIFCSDN
jgi:hypothetical protein